VGSPIRWRSVSATGELVGQQLRAVALPELPEFTLASDAFRDGDRLPRAQLSHYFSIFGGEDRSPELNWSGAPARTKSFAVTMFGSDESTGSGFWHWAVINIPQSVTSLPTGAGDQNSTKLPDGAVQLPNDIRASCYIGAGPYANGRDFHYSFVVHALDVRTVDVPAYSTPAYFLREAQNHIIARAALVASAAVLPPTGLMKGATPP
jgi:Raf kinase inhibitor-like YbhB/YbcL family protein